jgi:hypothetical protein
VLCWCDGDKTRKPSRNGVTAFFDSWVTAAYWKKWLTI